MFFAETTEIGNNVKYLILILNLSLIHQMHGFLKDYKIRSFLV